MRSRWALLLVASALSCGPSARGPSDDRTALIDGQERRLTLMAMESTKRGDYARSEALLQRVLADFTRLFGPESSRTAIALYNLGDLYAVLDDYARAEPFLRRSLAISEKIDGPESATVATASMGLGLLYVARWDFKRAGPLLIGAALTRMKVLGEHHVDTARAFLSWFEMLELEGQCPTKAVTPVREDLTKAEGPNSLLVARVIELQAACHLDEPNVDGPLITSLLEQALAIRQTTLGPNHISVAGALQSLAEIRRRMGDSAGAERYLERALPIAERTVDPKRVVFGDILDEAGLVYYNRGDYSRAEQALLRAVAVREGAFGKDDVLVGYSLEALAYLYWAKGDHARALAALDRTLAINDRYVSNAMSRGIEGERLSVLDKMKRNAWLAFSFEALSPPTDRAAVRVAFTALLRTKGRVLEAMGAPTRVLHARLGGDASARFENLLTVRRRQSRLEFMSLGKATHDETTRLFDDGKRLEAELDWDGASSGAAEPISVERVAAALPAGAALVDIAEYVPANLEAKAPVGPRFAAFVLSPAGEVGYADLGDAVSLDALVKRVRASFADPAAESRSAARELDERVMRPVRALLGSARRVFIAPDGSLSLVPLAALVDEKGDYLVKNWSFSYLTSGRDLLHVAAPGDRPRSPAVVLADPDFGPVESATAPGPTDSTLPSARLRSVTFDALGGTKAEGRVVADLLGVRPLIGPAATHDAITAVHGPSVLHVATHGFFLDNDALAQAQTRGLKLEGPAERHARATPVDGLDRSGLIFAGANRHRSDDDGILTASEASWLDLWGTELVVLSACDTGVGDVSAGDGVRGLQRAMLLSGARSLVMSLWKVDDDATRDLMAGFYARLSRGEGRSDALRDTQLELLAEPGRAHPFYWASFVHSGDARPLTTAVTRAP